MKIIKGLAFVVFLTTLLGGCFDPPEFPDKPEIIFEDLVYREFPGNQISDSLTLTILFKDGDGDVGLSSEDINFPFHELNFHIVNGTSEPQVIGTNDFFIQPLPDNKERRIDTSPYRVLAPGNVSGTLLTYRKIVNNPQYDDLPRLNAPFAKCLNYLIDTIYVVGYNANIIEDPETIVDTLKPGASSPPLPPIYAVLDTFYIEPNPNHHNLEVDFLTNDETLPGPRDPDGFVEFDWTTYSPIPGGCGQTFDARVPVLSGATRALDGSIRYSMRSVGFRDVLKNNLMKLRVRLRDRSLNISNEIKTPAFTLDDIKK